MLLNESVKATIEDAAQKLTGFADKTSWLKCQQTTLMSQREKETIRLKAGQYTAEIA